MTAVLQCLTTKPSDDRNRSLFSRVCNPPWVRNTHLRKTQSMKTYITERFTFEAAHRLDGIGNKNATIHGHSYEVFVTISGEPDSRYGWLIEQGEFQKRAKHVIGYLDHSYLNEFMELTTAEVIAQHIFLRLSENRFPDHITLESVKVCKVGMCAEVRG